MILRIKEKLYNNEDQIRDILEEIDCKNIHKTSQNQFRFGFDNEGSGSGNSLYIDTLSYKSFSRNTYGDILTLVSEMKNIELGEAIKWLADKLHIKREYTEKQNVVLPFGGFFKEYGKIKDDEETPPRVYDVTMLNQYIKHGVSKLFIEDGISALTQEMFRIGYSIEMNRVTIPWFNEYGLIGIMGRKNKRELGDKEQKYIPIIDFRKSTTLYGLYENYQKILNDGYLIIAESEKSVLKASELGLNVVALGGNNISPRQAKLIKSMFCKVIIALDEGISLQHNIEQAKKIQIDNVFFKNEVYIVDMNMEDNPYIKQEKISLLDLDKSTINEILDKHLIYIE